MKKVLFIDRDGTIIVEPPTDFQVDSFEKLAFLPEALIYLRKIVEETEYELVMVTNQDGLGTSSFPENTFWGPHNLMMDTLENQGIPFAEVLIDKTFPEENAPTRKPGTGLLQKYIYGNYDLQNSFVIGDRASDIQLADNLGAKGIHISPTQTTNAALTCTDWKSIYEFLIGQKRKASITRKTKETCISTTVDLDGSGKSEVSTGLGFFDHMLDQIAKHGNLDLSIKVEGDLNVDEHHTIEDTALALGECFAKALGGKKNTARYGFLLPMDDCLAQVAIDFGGRPWCVWDVNFSREKIGDVPTEMFFHFFKSFSDTAKCNLNIKCEGDNEHHKIESVFKAFARAIRMAVKRTVGEGIPSTKGVL